jgi:hypothetical protein
MLSLARFEPSCSVYGRECLLEFFRQRVGNDTDLGDLAGQARPAGADGDGVADLEAIEARDRKPRHNEPMPCRRFRSGSPGRTTEPGLTKTLPTTPSIIDRSLPSSWSAANSFRAQSASCEADDMVAICPSRARPSPPNDVSRTNGRWRMVGSTESVVIGSWLVGWSGLVSRFRRKPQPRHRRKNRVPGQRQ